MPYAGKAKTDGGIYIPDQAREREALATVVAYVLKLAHWLIKIQISLETIQKPWCEEGLGLHRQVCWV